MFDDTEEYVDIDDYNDFIFSAEFLRILLLGKWFETLIR